MSVWQRGGGGAEGGYAVQQRVRESVGQGPAVVMPADKVTRWCGDACDGALGMLAVERMLA